MRANPSRDAAAAEANEMDELPGGYLEGGGSGAASALERMKAEYALRHKRQHGSGARPGRDQDRTPGR